MTDISIQSVVKDGKMTAKSDKVGIEVLICAPSWFDENKQFKIANAPARTASLSFSGADLNFAARVLYAEASGAAQLPDKAIRDKEKQAILNVMHFRLGRSAYPSKKYTSSTLRGVSEAPDQFESVFKPTNKFVKSATPKFEALAKLDCAELAEAIEAVRSFLATGPDTLNFLYDEFRGYSPTGSGKHIGRSRFFLTKVGKGLHEKTP